MTVIWLETDKTIVNFKVEAHIVVFPSNKKKNTLQYSDSNNSDTNNIQI